MCFWQEVERLGISNSQKLFKWQQTKSRFIRESLSFLRTGLFFDEEKVKPLLGGRHGKVESSKKI